MIYSTDLKLRAIAYAEEGHTLAQTATVFKVHSWSINHWRKKYKVTGNVENKVRRPVNKKSYRKNSSNTLKHILMPILKKLQKSSTAVLLPF